MIHHELDKEKSILTLKPEGALESADFTKVSEEIDPYIESKGHLKGVMIYTASFPGWKGFADFLSHLRFVHDHHRKINRVAMVSDDKVLTIAPALAKHFVSAEVKHFAFNEKEKALIWLAT